MDLKAIPASKSPKDSSMRSVLSRASGEHCGAALVLRRSIFIQNAPDAALDEDRLRCTGKSRRTMRQFGMDESTDGAGSGEAATKGPRVES